MRWTTLWFFAGALFVASATSAQDSQFVTSAARPKVPTTDYENIPARKLLAAFRTAYVEAGFRFKQERTNMGGSKELHFDLPIHGYRHGKGFAVLIFSINSQGGLCAPCSVHRQTLGVPIDYGNYDADAINRARIVVFEADARANRRLKNELGKDLSDVKTPMAREP